MKASKSGWFNPFILSLLIAALSACHSDNDNSPEDPAPEPPMAPVNQPFNAQVVDLIQNQTSDTSEPLALNDLSFEFDDDDDNAFDALF